MVNTHFNGEPLSLSLPLFDVFVDTPHPAASATCPPLHVVVSSDSTKDLSPLISQISRFAFPEYEGPLGRDNHQLLNRNDRYAMQAPGFQFFTFTLQAHTGERYLGHVRRYLAPHTQALARYDVGRRGERALVLLTRNVGADSLYNDLLKLIEAVSLLGTALPKNLLPRTDHAKWLLDTVSHYHRHLSSVYVNQLVEERGNPLIAAVEGIELGTNAKYKNVDIHRFIFPPRLLHRLHLVDPSAFKSSSSILPLFRCVGCTHVLRITAALLSERRVLLMSHSSTRLCHCSHACLAILAQGMLHWQHLYMPVLPPHLWQYIAEPTPFLIGILASKAPTLDKVDGIGEVLIINLDTNSMETRGVDHSNILQRLPDLLVSAGQAATSVTNSLGSQVNLTSSSPIEYLIQDLMDIMKSDKRSMQGDANIANLGIETVAKTTQAVKNTFFKLRDKAKQHLHSRNSLGGEYGSSLPPSNGETESTADFESKPLAADYIYTEGYSNESAEEEIRVAFATFFLSMIGDIVKYLSTSDKGQFPKVDKNLFLQSKRAQGEGEGTPLWPLLQNFCDTQMFEDFSKARAEEYHLGQSVAADLPFFAQCILYHRQHKVDFSPLSVRSVCRKVSLANPSIIGQLQITVRRNAMALTSTRNFEGDYRKAVDLLVERCRESASVVGCVMSVIWLRLRDSRGLQWKHAYQALILLRELLLHGPLVAVAEATNGIDVIRSMKYYENIRSQASRQIQSVAESVYILLVDRAKLFKMRRFCLQHRRDINDINVLKHVTARDPPFVLNHSFRHVHATASPTSNSGDAVQMPLINPRSLSIDRTSTEGPLLDLLGSTVPEAVNTLPSKTSDGFNDVINLLDGISLQSPNESKMLPTMPNPIPISFSPSSGHTAFYTSSVPPSRNQFDPFS